MYFWQTLFIDILSDSYSLFIIILFLNNKFTIYIVIGHFWEFTLFTAIHLQQTDLTLHADVVLKVS